MTTAMRQGDLGLLDTDVAQRRLHTNSPLRLAYVAQDGTPRVIPVFFQWTGEEIVMGGFAPSVRGRALRANPNVAITIDTDEPPTEVLLIRGRAEVTEVRGLVPEYEQYMRPVMAEGEADAFFERLRDGEVPMERIAVRPAWVAVMDFQTRFPDSAPAWMKGEN